MAQRPPTVQEAAGADAEGKLVALANPRFERGRIGRNALVVDFVLQSGYEPGKVYFLVIKGGDEEVTTQVTSDLSRATKGEKDSFGVSVIGGNFPAGPLSVSVQTRKHSRDRDGGTTVSNVVVLQR